MHAGMYNIIQMQCFLSAGCCSAPSHTLLASQDREPVEADSETGSRGTEKTRNASGSEPNTNEPSVAGM